MQNRNIESNSNTEFLQTASEVMNELDIRYMEADLDGKLELKDELDRAMMTFSEARSKILENEIICTPDDLTHMRELRREVECAAAVQELVKVVVRLTRIMARL